MPEIRHCPLSGVKVLLSESRRGRPRDFGAAQVEFEGGECPFCVGNEHHTEREVGRVETEGEWSARIVANRFPGVDDEAEVGALPGAAGGSRMLVRERARGLHDVVIEHREHGLTWVEMPAAHLGSVLVMVAARVREMEATAGISHVTWFRNEGGLAGGSLRHPHSQIIGTPFVPDRMVEKLHRAERWWKENGECLVCALIAAEVSSGERVVLATPEFVVLCPWASRVKGEVWVLPRRHAARFGTSAVDHLEALGAVLVEVASRLANVFPGSAFNAVLHSAPVGEAHDDGGWHWHLELLPRLGAKGGYEMASGAWINSMSPETAAEALCGVPGGRS